MTRRRCLIAILAGLLVMLPLAPAFPASAQDLDAIAGKLDLADLDGIETAVSRTYAARVGILVESTSPATPATTTGEPLLMLALVAEFDTVDHAENATGDIQDRLSAQFDAITGTTIDIDDATRFGRDARRFSGAHISAGKPIEIDGFIVQRGRWVSVAIALGTGISTHFAARNLMDAMLVFRLGPDEVVYDVSGMSQGGIWNRLPDYDATQAISGLQPIYDNLIVPPAPPDAQG